MMRQESDFSNIEVDRGTTSSMKFYMDERNTFNNASVLHVPLPILQIPIPNQNPNLPFK